MKKNSRFALILMLGALSAFGPLNNDMYLPAFPQIANDYETTAMLVQLSLTGCLLGIAFGQLFVGPLSDVYGRRRPLLITLIVYTVASILCAFAPTMWIFILLRFIQGFAGAGGLVISRACVRDLYSGYEMTRIFSLLVLVMGVAPIFAPVVGGFLLNFFPWGGIFISLALFSIVLFVLVKLYFPETLPEQQRIKGGLQQTLIAFRNLLKHRLFTGYMLAMGFSSGAMFAYIAGSPFVLQEIFHMSPQVFSIIFGINALGLIITSQIIGRLAGRIDEGYFLIVGLSMQFGASLILLVAVLFHSDIVPILIALFFIVASIGFINSSCMSLAMKTQSNNVGSASALLGLISFFVGGLVAPFVGVSGSSSAVPMAIVVLFCSLAAVGSYLFIIRRKNSSKVEKRNNVVEI